MALLAMSLSVSPVSYAQLCLFVLPQVGYNFYNVSSELSNSLTLCHLSVLGMCVASVPVFSSVNSFNRCQFGSRCENVPVGFSGLFLCHYEDVCISEMCQQIHRCVTVVSVVYKL